MHNVGDLDLERRALAAWFRSGDNPMQPSHVDVEQLGDRTYVVLENTHEILAVYRVRAYDGRLRRMRRWPPELGQHH